MGARCQCPASSGLRHGRRWLQNLLSRPAPPGPRHLRHRSGRRASVLRCRPASSPAATLLGVMTWMRFSHCSLLWVFGVEARKGLHAIRTPEVCPAWPKFWLQSVIMFWWRQLATQLGLVSRRGRMPKGFLDHVEPFCSMLSLQQHFPGAEGSQKHTWPMPTPGRPNPL